MTIDPITLSVIHNRLDSIVREMSNTLLRAGRSTVLTTARDFSCAIVTSENDLLATAEGLPVHVVGASYQAKTMSQFHPDFREGDAFLHNDPYNGNTHAADHTILVPVFVGGEHMFTVCAKAHQADIGNSVPTTYTPFAQDVYEEGALIFPCVLIQRDYEDVEDIIRMCRARIRVPDQWYGDYLAMLGAARIGEKRLKDFVHQYGREVVRQFIVDWFDYSEQRTIYAIKEFPAAEFSFEGCHDPFPAVPDGVPFKAQVTVDPEEGRITVDLRDNIDCIPAGLNQSMVCSINNAVTGVFNCLDPTIPHNAGSFRCISILLRENCVVGIPRFPVSCSLATTNIGDRLVSVVQCAFAEQYPGRGLAEGAGGLGPGFGVVAGLDPRRNDEPYVSQIFLGSQGGPGTPWVDGWLVFSNPAAAGLLYRDSVELDEQRYPIIVDEITLVTDSEGAGKFRGAPGFRAVFGPIRAPMTVTYTVDHHYHPPVGVGGGEIGGKSDAYQLDNEGEVKEVPLVGAVRLLAGERVVSIHSGGGGYGSPLAREPELVRKDVLEGWVSMEKARNVYGVVFSSVIPDDTMQVDYAETRALRAELASSGELMGEKKEVFSRGSEATTAESC